MPTTHTHMKNEEKKLIKSEFLETSKDYFTGVGQSSLGFVLYLIHYLLPSRLQGHGCDLPISSIWQASYKSPTETT